MGLLALWQPITVLLFATLFVPFADCNCAFVGAPTGQPPKKLAKPSPPFMIKENPACPYYANTYGCCSDIQIQQLLQNFQDIDMIFGADCPICAVNQKLLWCEFTCSPNQSDHVRPENYYKYKHAGETWDVLNVTVLMSMNTTCQLYQSCDKVPETKMMASNGQGFIQFQV